MYQMFGTIRLEMHIVREQRLSACRVVAGDTQLFEPAAQPSQVGRPSISSSALGTDRRCGQRTVEQAQRSLMKAHLRHHHRQAAPQAQREAGSGQA